MRNPDSILSTGQGVLPKRRMGIVGRYTIIGVLFGLCFPIGATLLECMLDAGPLTVANMLRVQARNPLLWIIDSAPVWIVVLTILVDSKQNRLKQYARSLKGVIGDQSSELAETKKRLESILDSMADLLINLDNKGVIIGVNQSTLDLFGYQAQDLIGQSAAILIGQSDLEQILLNDTGDLFEKGFLGNIDGEYRTHGGSRIYLNMAVSFIWDEDGTQQGIVCVGRDITDLKESENKFAAIFRNASEAIISSDSSGAIIIWNDAATRMFGYTENEALGRNIDLLIPAHLEEAHKEGFSRFQESGKRTFDHPVELVGRHKNGKELDVELTLAHWQSSNETRVTAIFRDITTRKKLESIMVKAKEEFEGLISSAPIPMVVVQRNQFVFHNPEMEKFSGYSGDELNMNILDDLIHPEDFPRVLAAQARLEGGKQVEGNHPIRFLTATGDIRWADIRTTPFTWDEQPAALSFLVDTTQQRVMEKALKASELQYRNLVETLNVIILKADQEFKVTFLNQFGQDFFGYTEAEILGKSIIGTLTPATESTGRDLEKMIRQNVAHPEQLIDSENENITRNGDRKWVVWRNTPVFDDQGNLVEIMSSGYDVTERKKAEVKIRRQQQKLEAAQQQMTIEMEQARLAQMALLPGSLPTVSNLKLASKYSPMDQIGGDFYDVFLDRVGRLQLLVGDVTGHGIPAALLSFMFLTSFKNNRKLLSHPDEVINSANQFLSGKLPVGKYATVYCCTLDPESLILTYSSAGHPPAFLFRPGLDSPIMLETKGMVVGMFENPVQSYQAQSVQLCRGDKLVIYTDGMIEVEDDAKEMLDSETFVQFMLSRMHLPIDDLLEEIFEYCSTYAGEQGFNDDVTMIGLEVL
jgi:phosphoserine phosphatase RsbU/P